MTHEPRRFSIKLPRPMFVVASVVLATVMVGLWISTRSNWPLMVDNTPLSTVEESLLVAAYYRGGNPDDDVWRSNSDQIVTLSLYYTGDISANECVGLGIACAMAVGACASAAGNNAVAVWIAITGGIGLPPLVLYLVVCACIAFAD